MRPQTKADGGEPGRSATIGATIQYAARDSTPAPADNRADLLNDASRRPKPPSDLGVCGEVMVRHCHSVPDAAG